MRRVLPLVLLAACSPRVAPSPDVPTPDAAPPAAPLAPEVAEEATAGVDDPALRALLVDHWAWTLQASPELATWVGTPGYDHRVRDRSLPGAAAHDAARRALLARAHALDAARLAPSDARWLTLLRGRLEAAVASEACRFERWSLSARSNAMADLFGVLDVQPLASEADGRAWLARLEAFAAGMPDHLDALRVGRDEGLVANATSLGLVVEQVTAELDRPASTWAPARRAPPADAPWGADFLARREALLEGPVRAALTAWRDLLRDELIPVAPGDDAPGLAGLPLDDACYRARIRAYTTLPLTADALHETGRAEMARIHAAFLELGPRALGVDTLPGIFHRLRADPELRFTSREEILEAAEASLRRAEAAAPAWFGRLPHTPVVVAEIPAFEAPYTTIAYYRQPQPGVKPGEYFVNTFRPETRPRFEAQALAFHESVPGHHLQIALAYELPDAPAFHRYGGSTAFVEGWGLYAEGLADEMGLYSGDLDRLGLLSFDAWRAARLVVDTGLHARGWSRQQAEAYLRDNTPLALNNVANEVDRYITWPGQALAYKTGQLRILALRDEAQEALGDAFDVRGFHDAVLGRGAVSMPLLEAQVRAWTEARQKGSPP